MVLCRSAMLPHHNLVQIPIMEYVRDLENRIRKYQREGIRVSRIYFWLGFFTGSVLMSGLWFWIRSKG